MVKWKKYYKKLRRERDSYNKRLRNKSRYLMDFYSSLFGGYNYG